MMTAATPSPEPTPEEIQRGIAEVEQMLAEEAPQREARWGDLVRPVEPPAPSADDDREDEEDDDLDDEAEEEVFEPLVIDLTEGETSRVQRLRAEVAEAYLLERLQADPTPLRIDTKKVRDRRMKAGEAARLHELAQDPVMKAWQAARMRRLLVTAAMVSLTLALAWSTAGVHGFASEGATSWSPEWIVAWLVEPFLSLALLVVVGAKAYAGSRGQPIKSKTLNRVEALFLTLTLGMNTWQYLPGVAEVFNLSQLVLHMLGPIVTVAIVTALPIVLEAFSSFDHGTGHASTSSPLPPTAAPTGSPLLVRRTGQTPPRKKADIDELTKHARRLIAAGKLPHDASATAIRKALAPCGMDAARAVRDALKTQEETR